MLPSFIHMLRKNECYRFMEKNDINLKQLKEMAKKGAILVDVRSPQEYEEGHLEGSVLLPEYEIKNKFKSNLPDKQQEIIVYCSSGFRGKRAQKLLNELGYCNVYNLYGGLENY